MQEAVVARDGLAMLDQLMAGNLGKLERNGDRTRACKTCNLSRMALV